MVLAIKNNKFQLNELNDFFNDDILFAANSNKAAIEKLNQNEINLVVISINSNSDFGLIKYINDNFKSTKVVLSISREMQEAYSILTNGKFTAVEQPLKLKELKNVLKKTRRKK